MVWKHMVRNKSIAV